MFRDAKYIKNRKASISIEFLLCSMERLNEQNTENRLCGYINKKNTRTMTKQNI
jgi:hypothetical protein